MASCMTCQSQSNLNVWVIPDPYYGYGHSPEVICNNCPKPNNIWMEKHEYDSRRDDWFLGLTKCQIKIAWANDMNQVCTSCHKKIETYERGHQYQTEASMTARPKELWYCLPCFDQRRKVDKVV